MSLGGAVSMPGANRACAELSPFGCMLQTSGKLEDLSIDYLRRLALQHRLVIVRGCELLSGPAFVHYCRRWGELLEWNFGFLLDVVEQQSPTNYIFTHSNVPYHWDGAFASAVPSFQVFQCLDAGSPHSGGETLFADTIGVVEYAPPDLLSIWRNVEIVYVTQKVVHYGGRIRSPLLGRHPVLGRETLRFAEPFAEDTVKLNELELEVHGVESDRVPALFEQLRARLYDPEHCYAHAWQRGDVLFADNHALLHGRRAFSSGSRRHLQRVHVL
jgi:alpha-ketoglutarate-dependent taurine dioxygenase